MASANRVLVQQTTNQHTLISRVATELKFTVHDLDDERLLKVWNDCEERVKKIHWDADWLWAVNVDYLQDQVLKAVHSQVRRPLDLGPPSKVFGSPFSHGVLEWCYNHAVADNAPYMKARGAFHNLSEVTLRLEDRKNMWKSGQVPGLVHDYHVCPQPGMVWIPQIGQVCFESCVGETPERARSVLDEATKLVGGRDLVLAHGMLPNEHMALVLEFAPGADAESPAARLQYKRALLDLHEWQTWLLRGQVVMLDECLRGILRVRLQAGGQAQPPWFLEERKWLVNYYWTQESSVLLAAQHAALTFDKRHRAKTLLDGVPKNDEEATLGRLVQFVDCKGADSVLPLAERQAMVKQLAKPWVTLHIMRLWGKAGATGNLDATVDELVDFVRAAPSGQAKHEPWATISPPRHRWELMVQSLGKLDMLKRVEEAMLETERADLAGEPEPEQPDEGVQWPEKLLITPGAMEHLEGQH
ncbi:uncharacterized protein PG998_002912 [Apiospora kogelbergensis]|uniref:uncharacterized protein n=1 Tax=Apiospora kogelbergensis TaxID=1337665 RepID=UPI00313021C7